MLYNGAQAANGSLFPKSSSAPACAAVSMARVSRASVDLRCMDAHRGGPSALHLLAGFLARPELALVIGVVLRVSFDRVWGILLEERSIPRRERLPRGKPRSVRIAGLREPCPRSHDLIRERNLRPLQFAWLTAGLVQVHAEISAVVAQKHELNVARMCRERLEMPSRRCGIGHLREVIRRILVREIVAIDREAAVRGGQLSEDAASIAFEWICTDPVLSELRIIAKTREGILLLHGRAVGVILIDRHRNLWRTGEILGNAQPEIAAPIVLGRSPQHGHVLVLASCPCGFREDRDDGSIHNRTTKYKGSVCIGCSLQLKNTLGRQCAQTRGIGTARCSGEVISKGHRGRLWQEVLIRYGTALKDRPLKQSRGGRRYHVRRSIYRACRLAAERDVVGIAAEGCDVGTNPAERGLLIQNAIVGEGMPFANY